MERKDDKISPLFFDKDYTYVQILQCSDDHIAPNYCNNVMSSGAVYLVSPPHH